MKRGMPRVESRSLSGWASRYKPPAAKPLAVFDVDGTLFRRGLLPELTRRLVDEEIFSDRVREEPSRDYYAWVERRGSYEGYDNLVVELFQRELKGIIALKELRRFARAELEGPRPQAPLVHPRANPTPAGGWLLPFGHLRLPRRDTGHLYSNPWASTRRLEGCSPWIIRITIPGSGLATPSKTSSGYWRRSWRRPA